jgi:hypothetical protein
VSSVRAVTTITGFNDAGAPVAAQGEQVRVLHFETGEFSIETDTSVTPARVKVSLKDAFVAVITALGETVSGLAASVSTLLTFKTSAEPYAIAGGRWTVPEIYVATGGPESIDASFGQFIRANIENYGGGELLTLILPAVTSDDVGKRICFSSIGGPDVGAPNGEIEIMTTGGQAMDSGVAVPFQITGPRPKITLVAVEISTGVYGYSVEQET